MARTRKPYTSNLKVRPHAEEMGDLAVHFDSLLSKLKLDNEIKNRRSGNLKQLDSGTDDNVPLSSRENNMSGLYQLFLNKNQQTGYEKKINTERASTHLKSKK